MAPRRALGSARTPRRAAAPAAALITLGAITAPVVAAGGHRGPTPRAGAGSESHVRHVRGVVTAIAGDGSSIRITRMGREHGNCLAPSAATLLLGPATTFSTPADPTAALGDIRVGDAVTVAIAVPPRTDPTTVPATSVADRGPAAPITCVVRGVASGPGTSSGVTITVQRWGGEGGHRHGHHDSRPRGSGPRGRIAALPGSPISLDVLFGPRTTFIDIPDPGATIDRIARGDRLTVVWSAVPGTALSSLPAVQVTDWGPPRPIPYVARGTAASTPTGTSVGLAVWRIHPNVPPALADGSVLPVSYDAATVFVDVAGPAATIDGIAVGDRLIVIWRAPRGTQAANLPAAIRVEDLGPAGAAG